MVGAEEIGDTKVSWHQICMSAFVATGNCNLFRYMKHNARLITVSCLFSY